jgi:hypothetical protein
MQQRLERLLRYRESAERTTHFQAMPTIAVLVPHLHQQERWRHAGQEVCTTLRLDPLRGAVVALSPSQRLDSAWVLPWKGLESDAPCRLQDLLLPTALEALPPDFFPTMADSAIPGERTRLVIKGGYARRPKQVGAKGKQSAPHLLSLHLSERQQALLHLVYAAPLLSTVEIAALCALAPATATRQLYDLHRDGYLERQQTKRGCCWRLSCLGLRWMAALLDVSIQHLTQGTKDALIQRGVPLLERTIQHTAGIYGFLAHLHCDARAQGHQVAWWETGSWGERRYHEHGAWHSLRPDAAFAYRTGSAQILAWLEWDEGTMTGGALAAKFRAYAQYLHSREWAKEMRPLPLLLIVTPEPGQERRLQGLSGPLVAAGLRAFLTTATRLADQGPIAPIWLPPSATPSEAAASRQSWIE